MINITRKNDQKKSSLASKMLTSAMPLAMVAMAPTAFANTATNTAGVSLPPYASDPTPENNTATDTDDVLAVVTPTNDDGSGTAGTASTPIADITDGDTINGDPVVLGTNATISEVGTWPAGFSLNPATGAVDMDDTVAPGTYTMEYELCDNNTPQVCETATIEIVVEADIEPNTDEGTGVSGTASTPIADVTADDLVNGEAVDLGVNATISEVGTWPVGFSLNPATGAVDMDDTVAPGTYTMDYQLCDTNTPQNCETTTVTVVVEADIEPDNDSGTATSGVPATPVADVTDGDTVNGEPVDLGVNATISESGTWPAGITLDTATGAVSTDASVPAGTYVMEYELCDTNSPQNCEIATVTIVVEAGPIDAEPEVFPTINGADGGVTTSVLASDTLNGVAVDPNDVSITATSSSDPNVTLDPATGLITVAAGTPAGTYTVEYTICENNNPDNCASVTETVTVGAPEIDAEPEVFPTINGADGGVTTSVLASDTLNGVAVDPNDVSITATSSSDPNVTLDPATGLITVAAGTPAGTYTVEYTICENNNPDNCASVTETVTVGAPEIDAEPEVFPTINGADGGVTTSVLASDTLNGVAVDPNDVSITATSSSDPNVTLDPATGLITVAAGTPAGTYTVEYTICENNNPDNCASVTETVTVGAPEIDAEPEVFPTINGADGGVTTSVLASDTLNGVAVDPNDVSITATSSSDPNVTLDPATGLITVAAGTPAGTYTVEYTICENNNPDNCASVTETVTVGAPEIDAEPEVFPTINGADGGVTTSVLASDTLNGVAVDPNDVSITATSSSDPNVTLDPATGLITVAAGTPAGTYTVEYTICENNNPDNCASVTETVTVGAPEIDAEPEVFPTINGADGGVTTSVLASDTLNGVAVNPADVSITATSSSDPNVTLDPATGLITVAAGTPAGTYTVEYTICENNNPDNCASVTETVTVGAPEIDAEPEVFPTINGADGGVTTSVLASDTLNGVAVDPNDVSITATSSSDPNVTLDPATGLITVAAGTPAGTYTVEYTICENNNPDNCASVTETVTVGAPEIDAEPEVFPTINGADGGVTTSVLASDTLNGVAVDPNDVSITATSSSDPNVTLDPATGLITVAAGTPAGTYTVEYTICENNNPDNCASVTETVTVGAPEIDAEPEVFPTINGADGGVTTSVLASDTLNGVAVDPNDVSITATSSSDPNVTLDPATGLITVAAGTPAGTYTVEYTICENNNPDNCASVTETVTVGAPEIDAEPEVFPTINGADGGVTTSVLASDTLNGVAVDPNDVSITATSSSDPNVTLDPATGLITVAAGTPAGTYTVEYTICENNNPDNCASVTETVTVGAPEIDAEPEVFPTINGADGGVTTSVLASDTLNGVAVNPADVSITATSSSDPNVTLDPATGLITVAAGTPAGTYTVEYTICENNNPDNCASVTETVTVGAPEIDAEPEVFPTINGADGGVTTSVLASDTLNGVAVDPNDVSITATSSSDPNVTLDPATGLITVAAGTPAGTYTVEYTICENNNPDNCASVTETVTVGAPEIDAEPEVFPTINGADGGVTTSVLASDTLNGVAVNPADVSITATSSSDPNVTLDPATGLITVAAGTPAGTYTVEYTICENNNPDNCASVTETVTVGAPEIDAEPEVFPTINGADGGVTTSVLASDTLNGVAVDPNDVSITATSSSDPNVTLDPATGLITVAAGTPAGTYTVEYTICENNNPDNCASVTETVTVGAPEIDAEPEVFPTINGADGGVTTSVLASDTLNGVAVDPNDVSITATSSSDPNVTLDPATGLITVAAGTPAGTYTVEYTICENNNPDNCASVTETVTVGAPEIDAEPEVFPTINGADGGVTTSVLASDTLNGVAVDPNDVSITATSSSDPNVTLDPATGLITVAAGTPAGTYTVEYTICENNNPDNCASVTETVTVGAPEIDAEPEVFPTINGADGGVTTSVLASDTLNGVAVDPNDVSITATSSSDPNVTLDPATGLITVAAGTPAGTYTVEYTICENNNPDNCASVTETVTVGAPEIDAEPEVFPTINGADGGVTTSVLASDTLNGVAVDPNDVSITATSSSDPNVTLDPATGLITVAAGTPAGTYTVEYTICENNNPDNCASVTETVTVGAPEIDAEPEVFPTINGADGGVTTSVLASDTLNGVAVDPNDVSITATSSSDPNVTLDPATGLITVAAGTPAGTYTVEYTICENNNPDNCASVTETVTVGAPEITSDDDIALGIDGINGAIGVLNIFDNDTLNGGSIDPSTVTIRETVADPTGALTLNPDGSIDVAPGTPPGTYELTYEICESLNPTNCTTSVVTVTVEEPSAVLSGVVYFDTNGNNQPDTDETVFAGWTVQITDSKGDVIAEIITDENGYYEIELPLGEFSVSFIEPNTNEVYGTTDVELSSNSVSEGEPISAVVNLPIDPSGVVYDAITREPVAGTVMTMVDSLGQPLPPICFIDPSQQDQTTGTNGYYRFDIIAGAAAACPIGQTDYSIVFDAPDSHLDTNSTIIGAQPGFLSTNAGTGPLLVAPTTDAPQIGEDTTHYFGFTLGTGSRDVINNHIPLDPITLVRSPMDVIKTSPRRDVNFGDLVPYTITVTNTEDIPRVDLDIIDFTPPGFKYVEDTSRLNGVEVDPEINGRELILNDYDFAPNETKTWTMMMVVGAGVSDGIYTNQAYVRDPLGSEVSDRAEAVVRVSPDPLFDCSELIGKVFDDKNKDGYQNEGEPGMAGVRLATAKGLLVTTDDKGRYHIACAAIPNGQIGSNFILKVDERTLPTGYHLTSENPRVVRLTRGKMTKANFATALENIIRLDVTDAAYEFGSNTLRPEFSGQLGQIVDALKGQESILKITYYPSTMGSDERVEGLSSQIQELWEVYGGDYDLNIERKTVWPGGNSHQQSGAGE